MTEDTSFGPTITAQQQAQTEAVASASGRAYDSRTSERGVENEGARQLQSFYRGFGIRMPLDEAREQYRAGRTRAALSELLRTAKPAFLKDEHGLRGPQNPVKNLEADGMDGRGKDRQVQRRGGGSGSGSIAQSLDNAASLNVVALNVNGTSGKYNSYAEGPPEAL